MRSLQKMALTTLLSVMPAAASAGPETLEQLEPDRGEWELEWLSEFTGDGEQRFEALYGVGDRLAIGAEVEFEGPRYGLEFEGVAALALFRLTDPEAQGIGLGASGEMEIGRGGRLAKLEARTIAEWQDERWWLQGNAILRHAREDGLRGTGLAYSTSLQFNAADLWLGVEASGQAAHLSGDRPVAASGQHYAGPSITFEHEFGEDAEIEIGFAWLARLQGSGPKSAPRALVQVLF